MARQTIYITTGFAALLAFQVARFYRDLVKDNLTDLFFTRVLAAIAVLFVVACISNLVQIQLHQLLGQPIWSDEHKKVFRARLNILRFISWHGLLTAIILILWVLPYPKTWACYGVNFCYGLILYKYYFLKPPKDFPNAESTVIGSAAQEKNIQAVPTSGEIRLGVRKVESVIPESLRDNESVRQKQPQVSSGSPTRQRNSPRVFATMLLAFAALFWFTARQSKN